MPFLATDSDRLPWVKNALGLINSLRPQMTMGNLSHLLGNIVFLGVFSNGHPMSDLLINPHVGHESKCNLLVGFVSQREVGGLPALET